LPASVASSAVGTRYAASSSLGTGISA
jgi:hypothetical protein